MYQDPTFFWIALLQLKQIQFSFADDLGVDMDSHSFSSCLDLRSLILWLFQFPQWEKVDDKLAIGGLGFVALIALWAANGLIGVSSPDFSQALALYSKQILLGNESCPFIY